MPFEIEGLLSRPAGRNQHRSFEAAILASGKYGHVSLTLSSPRDNQGNFILISPHEIIFTIALINIHYLYTEFQTSWNMNIYDIDCNMNIYSWNMNNSNRTRNISKKKGIF